MDPSKRLTEMGTTAEHSLAQSRARQEAAAQRAAEASAGRGRGLPRILDWCFALLNGIAVIVLVWYVAPKLELMSSQDRDYHRQRLAESKSLLERVNETFAKSYGQSEERARVERQKAYAQIEILVQALTVDRKLEHEQFKAELLDMQGFLKKHSADRARDHDDFRKTMTAVEALLRDRQGGKP